VSKHRPLYIKLRLTILLLLTYLIWYVSVPRVKIHFSEEGSDQLVFTLNTQHDIFRWSISPGESAGGVGKLFPDEAFFMQFDWRVSNTMHCVMISPKWPATNIYIDARGDIDMSHESMTDVDRLGPCP
jgi:hypothetical protein